MGFISFLSYFVNSWFFCSCFTHKQQIKNLNPYPYVLCHKLIEGWVTYPKIIHKLTKSYGCYTIPNFLWVLRLYTGFVLENTFFNKIIILYKFDKKKLIIWYIMILYIVFFRCDSLQILTIFFSFYNRKKESHDSETLRTRQKENEKKRKKWEQHTGNEKFEPRYQRGTIEFHELLEKAYAKLFSPLHGLHKTNKPDIISCYYYIANVLILNLSQRYLSWESLRWRCKNLWFMIKFYIYFFNKSN